MLTLPVCRMGVEAQGFRLTLRLSRRWDGVKPRSVRGEIRGLSRASQGRLFALMNSLSFIPGSTSFLTLTYGRVFPEFVKSKVHLSVFRKALLRKWPKSSCVWVAEYQRRGAPHFHLVVYGPNPEALRVWAVRAWERVIRFSPLERRKHPYVDVRPIDNYVGLVKYLSKYLSKGSRPKPGGRGPQASGAAEPRQTFNSSAISDRPEVTGRMWGYFGSLPYAALRAAVAIVHRSNRMHLVRVVASILDDDPTIPDLRLFSRLDAGKTVNVYTSRAPDIIMEIEAAVKADEWLSLMRYTKRIQYDQQTLKLACRASHMTAYTRKRLTLGYCSLSKATTF